LVGNQQLNQASTTEKGVQRIWGQKYTDYSDVDTGISAQFYVSLVFYIGLTGFRVCAEQIPCELGFLRRAFPIEIGDNLWTATTQGTTVHDE